MPTYIIIVTGMAVVASLGFYSHDQLVQIWAVVGETIICAVAGINLANKD